MSQLLDYNKKLTKNRENNRKIIFGSELSEANDKPTFRFYQKIDKKSKKMEKIFLAQNCLKRIMRQLLDYIKKIDKNRENKSKNYFWVRIV